MSFIILFGEFNQLSTGDCCTHGHFLFDGVGRYLSFTSLYPHLLVYFCELFIHEIPRIEASTDLLDIMIFIYNDFKFRLTR